MGLTLDRMVATREAIDPVFWARRNVRLNGKPWNLDVAPFWAEPMRDAHGDVVFRCSRKTFKSTGGVVADCAFLAVHPFSDVAYLVPRWVPQGTKFSKQILNPVLQASTLNDRLVGKGDIHVKEFQGDEPGDLRHLFVDGVHAGGQGDEMGAATRGLVADRVRLDEYQQMSPQILEVVGPALYNSEFRQQRLQGTPNAPVGTLDEAWDESDQRRWMLTCPACGKEQWLTEDNVQQPKGREPYFGCTKCGAELDRATGRWVALQPENADFRHGYGMCQAMLLNKGAKFVVDERRRYSSLARFKNEVWGEAHADSSTQPFPPGFAEGCKEPGLALGSLPEGAVLEQIVIGVDAGDPSWVLVEGVLGSGHRVWMDVFGVGKQDKPWVEYTDDQRQHFKLTAARLSHHELAESDTAMVDEGYATGRENDLRVLPCKVLKCRYTSTSDFSARDGVQCPFRGQLVTQEFCQLSCNIFDCTLKGFGQRIYFNPVNGMVKADRTYILDQLSEDFYHRKVVIPYAEPALVDWALSMFHNIIPEKRATSVPGVERTVYVKVGKKSPDHIAHCAVYCKLASLGPDYLGGGGGGLPIVSAEMKIG